MLALFGTCINSKKSGTGKICMWIHISGRQNDDLGKLSSGIVTRWGGWRSGQRWRPLWCRLSASVWWKCTCSCMSLACLWMVCGAIWERKASSVLVLTKHCRVSFYRSLYLFKLRELNTPLLLFSDLGARFIDQVMCFLYHGAQNPSLAILAIFRARRMSDCCSWTRPPCVSIVADMLKTFKESVAASNNEIRLLSEPYTLP